jgi:hypothetical protein
MSLSQFLNYLIENSNNSLFLIDKQNFEADDRVNAISKYKNFIHFCRKLNQLKTDTKI